MGHSQMSKTLRPHVFGESKDNPARSLLLLKAWALWRARQNGWADAARPGRKRHFQNMAAQLVRELSAFGPNGLDHGKANDQLRVWAPDVLDAATGALAR